jgi:hypothetical protein
MGRFADGSTTIGQAFARLVHSYGVPGPVSAALEAADPAHTPPNDILGNPRLSSPNIGAYEKPFEVTAEIYLPAVLKYD